MYFFAHRASIQTMMARHSPRPCHHRMNAGSKGGGGGGESWENRPLFKTYAHHVGIITIQARETRFVNRLSKMHCIMHLCWWCKMKQWILVFRSAFSSMVSCWFKRFAVDSFFFFLGGGMNEEGKCVHFGGGGTK